MAVRRAIVLLTGLLAALVVNTGCFDVENEVTLNVASSGEIKLVLKFPASMSRIIQVSRVRGQRNLLLAHNIVAPPSKITFKQDKTGSFIIEKVMFSSLDEVRSNYPLGRVQYAVTEVVRPGATRKGTYRLSVTLRPPPGVHIASKSPSGRVITPKKRAQIIEMIRTMFKKRQCVIRFKLPAPAINAGTFSEGSSLFWDFLDEGLVSRDAVAVNPELSEDGQTVNWRIPLLKLVGRIGG
ncbi:MAG: hypothetical protein KKC37_10180, partial [Proteobacteria bacterium]|nr:hypothetical protein [Pseudomonadota bacterium]